MGTPKGSDRPRSRLMAAAAAIARGCGTEKRHHEHVDIVDRHFHLVVDLRRRYPAVVAKGNRAGLLGGANNDSNSSASPGVKHSGIVVGLRYPRTTRPAATTNMAAVVAQTAFRKLRKRVCSRNATELVLVHGATDDAAVRVDDGVPVIGQVGLLIDDRGPDPPLTSLAVRSSAPFAVSSAGPPTAATCLTTRSSRCDAGPPHGGGGRRG